MLYLYYSAPSISNGWCTLYSKHEYSFLWTRNRLWLHSVRSFFVSTQINHMRRQSSRFYSTWRQYNKLCLNLDLIYTNRLFYQVVFWQFGKKEWDEYGITSFGHFQFKGWILQIWSLFTIDYYQNHTVLSFLYLNLNRTYISMPWHAIFFIPVWFSIIVFLWNCLFHNYFLLIWNFIWKCKWK